MHAADGSSSELSHVSDDHSPARRSAFAQWRYASTTVTTTTTRGLASDGEISEELGIGAERGGSVDPQRFIESRNEKQQRDANAGDEILKGVEPVVAGVVGPRQLSRAEHPHEARRAAFRRRVTRALGIRSRHDEERRLGEELRTMTVEFVDDLVERSARRRAIDRSKLVHGRQPHESMVADRVRANHRHRPTGRSE